MNGRHKTVKSLVGVDEEITILCAVRYAMGRSSYAPGSVMDYIRYRVKYMPKNQILKLIDNLTRDYDESDLGVGFAYSKEWLELIGDLRDIYNRL